MIDKVQQNTLIGIDRLNFIAKALKDTKNIPGDMVEIGVYKGGSSYFIASQNLDKTLYCCDSFEGLPETTSKDKDKKHYHFKGDFADTSFEHVKNLLSDFTNIEIIKGFFPKIEIHKQMYDKQFSFVHLDVDLYKPTIECLEFFYARMPKGAILVSDDYMWLHTPGVKTAFDEFLSDKPEQLVDSGFNSCMFVKE